MTYIETNETSQIGPEPSSTMQARKCFKLVENWARQFLDGMKEMDSW